MSVLFAVCKRLTGLGNSYHIVDFFFHPGKSLL